MLVGAGSRGRDTAGGFALRHPDKLKFVAVAEPDDERRATFARLHSLPDQNCFSSYEALFDRPPLAPVCFNLTMDRTHLESSVMALEKGYHLFLEKPMAHTAEACFAIREAARKHKRMVQICHPLRYTPFYNKVRELIDSGIIGDLTSVSMSENVGYWHYAHSYVRGNWRRKCLQMLETYLRRCDGIDAGTFMERWSWVLFCVQENRAWTEELLAMARELFEAQAKADKPSLRYHRPSFAHESAQAAARSEATPPVRPTRRR